jgi:hypothetical protein
MTALQAAALTDLRARLSGAVLTPDDAGYDAARAAWNRTIDQHPALIVAAAQANDVVEAVRFAGEQGLPVAVQATGHGLARPADGALLILTSAMQGVSVDAEARTARVEAGVRWGKVLAQAQAHGLAPLLGSSPGVGAVGYTLGGGMGWLARKYGLAVDSVRWFEGVTGRGEFVRASDAQHTDLFWGLRGGGGANYLIVTAMESALYPVAQVYAGSLFYPIGQAQALLRRYRDWIAELPDDMTSSALIMHFPPLPELPDALRGQSFAILRGCHAGELADGQALIDSWRAWQPPAIDAFGPMPFSAVASISQDPVDPVPGYNDGVFLADLDDDVIETVLRFAAPQAGPPPWVKAEIHHAGGAIGRARREDMAVSHRQLPLLLHVLGVTPTEAAVEAVARHSDALFAALGAHAVRARYPNFSDGRAQIAHVQHLFEADKHPRLQALKTAYDPDNRFAFGFGAPH